MQRTLGPTGLWLVGAVFISYCIFASALATELSSNLPDLKSELKASQFGSLDHHSKYAAENFNTKGNFISLPWISRSSSYSLNHRKDLMLKDPPSNEQIILDESNSDQHVSDLVAMNSIKQRDITCDLSQNGDSKANGLSNSIDLSINSPGQSTKSSIENGMFDDRIEEIVDNALINCMNNNGNNSQTMRSHSSGNNMNIDVSGVSVSAINTVEGGSAVATSNIIIKPVQIIVCPSEVGEKLK